MLHYAAFENRLSTAECLIDAGANVNARNKQGRTPLTTACCDGSPDVARLLLRSGADKVRPSAWGLLDRHALPAVPGRS